MLDRPWQQARPGVDVKLLPQGELYVFAESPIASSKNARCATPARWLWKRLQEITAMKVPREEMPISWVPQVPRSPASPGRYRDGQGGHGIHFTLNRKKLRRVRRREGRYLLRTNLSESDPGQLWQYYTHSSRSKPRSRPQRRFGDSPDLPSERAHRHPYLRRFPGLLPAGHVAASPAYSGTRTDCAQCPRKIGRRPDDRRLSADHRRRGLLLTRYTQPTPELRLLMRQLELDLPAQPPPRITARTGPSHLL